MHDEDISYQYHHNPSQPTPKEKGIIYRKKRRYKKEPTQLIIHGRVVIRITRWRTIVNQIKKINYFIIFDYVTVYLAHDPLV